MNSTRNLYSIHKKFTYDWKKAHKYMETKQHAADQAIDQKENIGYQKLSETIKTKTQLFKLHGMQQKQF